LGIANASLVFALMEGSDFGWTSLLITGLFSLAFTSYFLFFKIEKVTAFPIIDFAIFKNKQYFIVAIVLFCMQFCIVTRMFLAITFQLAFGKTPTAAGLLVFPATLPIIFMAPVAGILLGIFGLRKVIYTGMICVLLSFIWLVFFLNPDNYILLFMGLLLFGVSFPLAMIPSVTVSITSVEQDKRGMASGIVNQLRQLATTFGVAVFGAITTHYQTTSNSYLAGFRLSILITIVFIVTAIILVWRTAHRH